MPARQTPASEARSRAAKTREANRAKAALERADVLKDLRSESEVAWVPVTQCFRDMTYQRATNEARVRAMRDEFDPDMLGLVTLSLRSDGRYAIMDGGHRIDLYHLMEWSDQTIYSLVYKGLTIEQEAHIYTVMNRDRVRPTASNLFLARVTARDPRAMLLKEAIEAGGAVIAADYRPGPRYFRAIAEAERVFKAAGPEVVRQAVWCMTEAWGERENEDTYAGSVFSGIAYIIHTFKGRVDVLTLAEKLKDMTPNLIINQAKSMRDVTHQQSVVCTAQVVQLTYNKYLRSRRLPEIPTAGWGKSVAQVVAELHQSVNVPYVTERGAIIPPIEHETL